MNLYLRLSNIHLDIRLICIDLFVFNYYSDRAAVLRVCYSMTNRSYKIVKFLSLQEVPMKRKLDLAKRRKIKSDSYSVITGIYRCNLRYITNYFKRV